MSIVSALLAPFALLLHGAGAAEQVRDRADVPAPVMLATNVTDAGLFASVPSVSLGFDPTDGSAWQIIAESFRAQTQEQVRIEQRVTIRITPHRQPVQPDMLMDLPDREIGPQFIERHMGRCLPISGIAGVQVSGGRNLILFMRDRRMVSAALERACRARDFYSGFYVERNSDGQLCVDRDTLLSRSGTNCKLTRFRQLVEADD